LKSFSDETFQWLKQLYQPSSLPGKLMLEPAEVISIMEKIERSAEPRAALHLLAIALSHENEKAILAARAIHNLISPLSVSDLVSLDEQARLYDQPYPYIYGWGGIKQSDLSALDVPLEYQVSVLGICSFHNNGFVRQKAVLELTKIWAGKELPFLLIRLDDWVPNVRVAAAEAVTARLQPAYAYHWADCLPLALQINRRKRVSESELVLSIRNLLQTEFARPAVFDGLNSADSFARRAYFQVALDSGGVNLPELIERGSKDPDNLIRIWCVQKVRQIKEDSQANRLLERFRNAAFLPVRLEAIRILAEKNPVQAMQIYTVALLDAHVVIRFYARYQITSLGGMDFAAFYRDSVAQGKEIYPAICGLGETGNASDEEIILPYANHPHPKIRRAAIKALGRLNPKANIELFFQALVDPLPGVSREALKALEMDKHLLGPQRLWEAFENASLPHVKKNLLCLIAMLSKWESIFYLLKAAVSTDQLLSTTAYKLIRTWLSNYNSSFTNPTAQQKTVFIQFLADHRTALNTKVYAEIESILKSSR